MIEKELTIASDFPEVSFDKWRASVMTDLKGVPFEKKLVHRSLEGFDIQPVYTANDWPSDRDSSGFPGFLPLTRGSQAPHLMQEIGLFGSEGGATDTRRPYPIRSLRVPNAQALSGRDRSP